MKKSLQDQLVKAGLGNKQQARKINTAKKKNKGSDISQQQATANAAAKKAEQAARDRQRNLDIQKAAEAKAAQVQITQLIESNKVRLSNRGLPFYFIVNNKVKKFLVDERTRIQLTFGQFGVVQMLKGDEPSFHVVPDTTIEKLRARGAAEAVVCVNTPKSLAEYLESNCIEDWSYPKGVFDH